MLENDSTIVEDNEVEETLDETLIRTLKEINEKEPSEVEVQAEEAPESGRERDEKGRFAEVGKEEPAPMPAEEPDIEPPSTWRKDAKERWKSLDKELKQELRKREDDYMSGISRYKAGHEWASQFAPLAPRLQSLRDQFGSESEGLKHFFELSDYSERDPVGFLTWFAKVQNIDLASLVSGAQENPSKETAKPDFSWKPQVGQIQQQLQDLKRHIDNEAEARAKEELKVIEKDIADFSKDKEHFEDLRGDMARILEAGLAKNLAEAYDAAIMIRPDIREKELAKRQAQAVEESKKVAAEKAKEARKASGISTRQHGVLDSKPVAGRLEDDLRETARKLGMID